MEKQSNQELADKMVNNFINNFVETFGVKPRVIYKVDSSIPTLNEIFDCVNEQYQLHYPKSEPEVYYQKEIGDTAHCTSFVGKLTGLDWTNETIK